MKDYNIKDDICCIVVTYMADLCVAEKIEHYASFLDHIVVVDNGSEMTFLETIRTINHVALIENEKNLGIAQALNQGLGFSESIGALLTLTLDQDSFISESVVKEMCSVIDMENGIVSVGPSYLNREIHEQSEASYLITSGNLFFTEVAREVGGYNSNLFIDCVDIDFSFALRERGYHLFRLDSVVMRHKIGEYENSSLFRIQYLSHAPYRFYYIYRNTIIVAKKYRKELKWDCFKLIVALIMIDTGKLFFLENRKREKIQYAVKGIVAGFNDDYSILTK